MHHLSSLLMRLYQHAKLTKTSLTKTMAYRSKEGRFCHYQTVPLVVVCCFLSNMLWASATDDLKQRLAKITTLEARFTQMVYDHQGALVQASSGTIWLADAAQFRLVIDPPDQQTLVSNGVDFWAYDVDLEQAVVRRLDANIQQMPILIFDRPEHLDSAYQVSSYIDGHIQYFVLESKHSESLFDVFTIGFSDSQPRSIYIRDGLSQTTRLEFQQVLLNQPIDSSTFRFELPAGVDLIDDR